LKLQTKFIGRLDGYLNDIKTALERNDLDKAHAVLHQLKGIGGSLGLPKITKMAAEMKEYLKDGNDNAAEEKLNAMVDYKVSIGG
jgi:HPt (histidine-containing phosphotransfer) domain-containing protein